MVLGWGVGRGCWKLVWRCDFVRWLGDGVGRGCKDLVLGGGFGSCCCVVVL